MLRARQFKALKLILKGVAIIYAISFTAALVLAFDGITPQSDPGLYPLLALVIGAIGVAIALRVAETTCLSYMVGIGTGLWLLSGTSVFFGAQSFLNWIDSSVFVATTVFLGRLLLGRNQGKPRALDLSLTGIVNTRNSALLEHRAEKSSF